jgi:hypothetical protein
MRMCDGLGSGHPRSRSHNSQGQPVHIFGSAFMLLIFSGTPRSQHTGFRGRLSCVGGGNGAKRKTLSNLGARRRLARVGSLQQPPHPVALDRGQHRTRLPRHRVGARRFLVGGCEMPVDVHIEEQPPGASWAPAGLALPSGTWTGFDAVPSSPDP